jgi:hypothetical protein
MVDRLYDNNSVVTGNLARSITPQSLQDTNNFFVLPITMETYGKWVDDGAERGAGKMPPVRAIADWIRQKRINVPGKFTTEQFAWAIARNIAKKGQRFKKPKPFIEISLNQVFMSNTNNIGNAFAMDVENYIEQNYSTLG